VQCKTRAAAANGERRVRATIHTMAQQAQQQQPRPWWQQSPCALLHGFQQNVQRLVESPPWLQPSRPGADAGPDPGHLRFRAPPKQVTREELGRASWVFLHTLAAQFPERPSRQQQRDARNLVDALTRIYPCADCAKHFADIVKWVWAWVTAFGVCGGGRGAEYSRCKGFDVNLHSDTSCCHHTSTQPHHITHITPPLQV